MTQPAPEQIYPQITDDRYDLRLKLRLAQAHLKIAETGVIEHALAAIAELAMGKKLDGRPIAVHPRTKVQAARTLLASAASLTPKDPLVAITQTTVQVGVDRDAYKRALANPQTRKAANTLLQELHELQGKKLGAGAIQVLVMVTFSQSCCASNKVRRFRHSAWREQTGKAALVRPNIPHQESWLTGVLNLPVTTMMGTE